MEQLHAHQHEHLNEQPETHTEKTVEKEPKKHEQIEQKPSTEQARQHAKEEAKSTAEILEHLKPEQPQTQEDHAFASHELKEMAYSRLIARAQRHLTPYNRSWSRLIHQPVVEAVSDTAARTVARPSGIIGGGFIGLIGTTAYYLIARHYGYSYNFLVFIAFISVGFVIGWIVELLWRLIRHKKN